ncbi:MAG: shikimate kinase [Candidatus Methanolliviera hydrocarbonicum]|uniref:Shikimate kinase n=1 Tax=Candidatus Methanolliviera hydrocarbonicum TaxID=2491085 RepID=A0A520KY79_9EURY|nr:MAG: shikimate kinase [Candidatus Methanolliviera hydrocarbonicum]
MRGRARACGAGTIINAISMGKGCAFAIDLFTEATVEIGKDLRGVGGEIEGGGDTTLIKKCVELVLNRFNCDYGAYVRTKSDIPMAKGLKSSSAASNAVVLATLSALGEHENLSEEDVINIGVDASIASNVTITGAYDDASSSLLGGIILTDNYKREIIKKVEMERDVLILVPAEDSYTIKTDVRASRLVAPWVKLAYDLALKGEFERAMTLNGFLYTSVLRFSQEPILNALAAGAKGVTLSGTGTSYVAWVDGEDKYKLIEGWKKLGKIIDTRINNEGAKIID